MKLLSFRTRLLISFWLVLAPALCLPGVYFYHNLEKGFIAEAEQNALSHLRFIGWLMNKDAPLSDRKGLYEWCREIDRRLGYRITIIDPGGSVMVDSRLRYPEIRFMENHAGRPEIMAAASGKPGFSVRKSPTLKRKLIYAAEKFRFGPRVSGGRGLFLRVAVPLSDIKTKLSGYGTRFLAGLFAIFLFTFLVSFFFAKNLEKPVYRLLNRFESIGSGDFSHSYIMDAGKEFYLLSSALNSMADRISAQVAEIKRQKEDLAAILENLKEGVMLVSPGGNIQMLNAALSRMTGYQGPVAGKKPLEVFMTPGVQELCDKILGGAAEAGEQLVFPDKRTYEIYGVRTGDGGAVMVFHDISEKKRVDRIRQDFVANVSHELKTPLTSIKGYAETLVSGNFIPKETGENFLCIIKRNADRMIAMVDDLLALTRLEQNPINREMVPVDARACLSNAIDTCRPMIERKKCRAEIRMPSELYVMAEKNTLERVFLNLAENAVQYSPENGTILFSASVGEKMVTFSVRDEGPGIPASKQERIFERFYRVDKERSRKTGGTGLGLSICKNSVLQMGGRIWVESPPKSTNTGSEFFFTLKSFSR